VVMRCRAVVVPLRKPVMRMEAVGHRIVVVPWDKVRMLVTVRHSIVIMPMGGHSITVVCMPDVGCESDLPQQRRVGRVDRHSLNFGLEVVRMIEHSACKGVGGMIDLEDVLELVEYDNRHLHRQRHAQRHAEHGDVPFGDCKTLADHDSSRGSGTGDYR
jgi:hypothetical protein